MNNLIKGGFLSGYRTYLVSVSGIISAVVGYLIGDLDVFILLQSIFTFGGIYFLRKSNENKGKK